jgi:heptosyltransferase-2
VKILVLAPTWVGDSILMLPALSALRKGHPEAELSLLASRPICDLHAANALVDRRIAVSKASRGAYLRSLRSLTREAYDLALVFPDSFSSALGAWLTGSRQRIGYAAGGRSWLLSRALPLPAPGTHSRQKYLSLAMAAGGADPGTKTLPLPLTREGLEERKRLFGGLHGSPKKWVGLCPTSAWPSKQWPARHFSTLAGLFKKKGWSPLLFGAAWEKTLLEKIAMDSGAGIPVLTPSLPGLAACLAQVGGVVANDSGPLHLAAAVGTPWVGLYGPVSPAWGAPHSKNGRIVYRAIECSPCRKSVCPLGHHRCLEEIQPEDVLKEFLKAA